MLIFLIATGDRTGWRNTKLGGVEAEISYHDGLQISSKKTSMSENVSDIWLRLAMYYIQEIQRLEIMLNRTHFERTWSMKSTTNANSHT